MRDSFVIVIRTHQDDVAETTRGEQQVDPVFELVNLHIETGRDNTSLVQSSVELDDNLSGAVIVDNFKLADVAWSQELASAKETKRCTSYDESKNHGECRFFNCL